MDVLKTLFYQTLLQLPADVLKAYFEAPAASKHHQNYTGGLVEHSCKLASELFKRTAEGGATRNIIALTPKECVVIGALHDLCKVGLYTLNEDGSYSTNKELYPHHALRSVELCAEYGIELNQTERVCILLHMAGAWWNQEDVDALTESDREWLLNHFDIVSAVQWADMKACE